MKKILSMALAAAMVLSMAACGGAPAASGATSAPAPADGAASTSASAPAAGKTVVNFWHCMGSANGDRIAAMVERYNKSQNEIELVATFQGSYEEGNAKLQTAIAGNTAPDIVQLERAFVEPYATADRLEDLKPYMEGGPVKPEDFVEGLMGYSYYNDNGKLVSIPFSRSTPILYYNKDAFKEVGLDPEKGPETWDDVYEYAKKLTKKDGDKTTRYGITWPVATWYFKANVAQLGGRTINESKDAVGFYDNGTGKKVFEYWTKLSNEGLFMVPPTKDAATVARQAFLNGEAAMFQESTSLIGVITDSATFEVGAAFLPYAPGGKPAMPTGGANIAMLADSKNKEAAWKVIEWMISDPEGCLQFELDSGYMPFTKQMVEDPKIKEKWEQYPMFRVAFDQLQYAVDTEQHLYWAELKSELLASLQAVMNDNADIQKTLDDLNKKSKDILTQ